MVPKISQVIVALKAHNGALRLDRVLKACGIAPTAENLHDTSDQLEAWRMGWTADDEDARLAIPSTAGGNVIGLATTKAQTRFGVKDDCYKDGAQDSNPGHYAPFPDDPRVKARKAVDPSKPKPKRWIPCLVLCSPALLADAADLVGDVQTTLSTLDSDVRCLFGEIKSARPAVQAGWAMVTLLVKLPE